MNDQTKKEVKKNVVAGVSTAAGATAGVVIGAAVAPDTAEAAEVETTEPEATVEVQPVQQHSHTHQQPEAEPAPKPEQPSPAQPINPGNANNGSHQQEINNHQQGHQVDPVKPPHPEPAEVEVLSYDRVTNEDGNRMDVAVISVDGSEIGIIDANLDGYADAMMSDVNQNGIIEEDEMEIVIGQGIEMQPFADAAGFNQQFAQNDLPDYVNDADVDDFMA